MLLQLMNWHKRRSNIPSKPCLYSVVPHSGQDPTHIVLRPVHKDQHALLDPRGAFLLNMPDVLFLWKVCLPCGSQECMAFTLLTMPASAIYQNIDMRDKL